MQCSVQKVAVKVSVNIKQPEVAFPTSIEPSQLAKNFSLLLSALFSPRRNQIGSAIHKLLFLFDRAYLSEMARELRFCLKSLFSRTLAKISSHYFSNTFSYGGKGFLTPASFNKRRAARICLFTFSTIGSS